MGRVGLGVLLGILLLTGMPTQSAEIALIIDDLGNRRTDAKAFSLPKQVAVSILPHTTLSTQYSQRAAEQQREVLLHIPMESLNGSPLGPGAITSDMYPQAIKTTLAAAIKTVPHAIGINNHMGSKLTQLTLPMKTTMTFLQQERLFFVDSRTTRFSKAERIAREMGVSSSRRNVFLDHDATPEAIDAQFQRLVRLSRKYGAAVGIAHPYPVTMEYLQQRLNTLSELEVKLVPVTQVIESQYLARQRQQEQAGSAAME